MALQYTAVKRKTGKNFRAHYVKVTVGAAGDYSTGLSPTAAGAGLAPSSLIDYWEVIASSIGAAWYMDPSSGKIRGWVQGAGAGPLTEITGAQANGAVLILKAVQIANP